MINLLIIGHEHYNEVQTMTQVFLPNLHFKSVSEVSIEGITVCSEFKDYRIITKIFDSAISVSEDTQIVDFYDTRSLQLYVKLSVYFAFSFIFDSRTIPWGILTGIRPTKIVHELWSSGLSTKEVEKILEYQYKVTPAKINLAVNIAFAEQRILSVNNADDISVYIGIPFCPSRCFYCSFTSYPIGLYEHKIDEYLNALSKELESCRQYIEKHNIVSLYIGGGTPTSLGNEYLIKLFEIISNVINPFEVREFTVEAGRPDTITAQKLKTMKQYGVSRISINPQSMNDKTLQFIGRNHLAADVVHTFYESRTAGFNNINMDIILGLFKENILDVESTLQQILDILPDSITVHTLFVKRASQLKEKIESFELTKACEIEKMLALSEYYAKKMEMFPYYMYRQKNMIGNFENIGYCKEKCECIYNIQIMEEKQSILAFGAGATSKIIELGSGRLYRIFNVKNVDEYINRIDEMIERKRMNNISVFKRFD